MSSLLNSIHKKTLLILAILTGFFCNSSYALNQATPVEIQILLYDAKDAYSISMPLLAASMVGNNSLYHEALEKMKVALDKPYSKEKNAYRAWLYGRILQAANNMNDASVVKESLFNLNRLLIDPDTKKDEFYAWALGYQASLNYNEYQKVKPSLTKIADELTNQYFNQLQTRSDGKIQSFRSNALWTWIMCLQAAGNANDRNFYDYAWEKIEKITLADSRTALTQGLKHTAASNDYPAWGIAIARVAAAKLQDQTRFNQLGVPFDNAIQQAKKINATAEIILGNLYNQLALKYTHYTSRYEILTRR